MSTKILFLLAVSCATSLALQTASERPQCDSHHLGQFWPQLPGKDSQAVRKLVQAGELQVCSRSSPWRFRWEQISVTINQLKNRSKNSAQNRPDKD